MPIPKKSLGQNFLMHARTAERIADAANLLQEGTVLEIGPGTGMLTSALLQRAKKVIAVEADRDLLPTLQEKFAKEIKNKKLVLIHADIREFDPSIIKGEYALVANIPYYLTGEIIRMFLTTQHKPSSITVLVQKEVAERIARAKKESILSLSVKVFGTPKYCFTVPRGAFFPAPNVDSAVISIQNIRRDAFKNLTAEELFFTIVKIGFAHKRKQLAGNLEELFTKNSITEALGIANLRADVRPEDLQLLHWQILSAHLKKNVV